MSLRDVPETNTTVAGQQFHWGEAFPWIISNNALCGTLQDTQAWLADNRRDLCERVERCGAILFRDFPLRTDIDFDTFIASFGLPNFRYEDSLSNAVRISKTARVFTANEAPANVNIFLHHEMAQTPIFPSKLFFFCEKAAEQGGATPICRSDVLWERIAEQIPGFAADCQQKGLRYTNIMPSENDASSGMGRSWQSTLNARTRSEAEQRLTQLNYHWEWLNDGCLRVTTPVLPAVRQLASGRKSFFNQMIAAYRGWKDSRNDPAKAITFGDGSPLDSDAAHRILEMADQLSFDIPWQNGDVVLIDNFVAMHGRRTFSGTRKVLASLVAYEA